MQSVCVDRLDCYGFKYSFENQRIIIIIIINIELTALVVMVVTWKWQNSVLTTCPFEQFCCGTRDDEANCVFLLYIYFIADRFVQSRFPRMYNKHMCVCTCMRQLQIDCCSIRFLFSVFEFFRNKNVIKHIASYIKIRNWRIASGSLNFRWILSPVRLEKLPLCFASHIDLDGKIIINLLIYSDGTLNIFVLFKNWTVTNWMVKCLCNFQMCK